MMITSAPSRASAIDPHGFTPNDSIPTGSIVGGPATRTSAPSRVIVGFVLSLGVTRVLQSVLYGTSSAHSGLYIVTAAILLVPILVASYIPARRAARVGPMAALRQD